MDDAQRNTGVLEPPPQPANAAAASRPPRGAPGTGGEPPSQELPRPDVGSRMALDAAADELCRARIATFLARLTIPAASAAPDEMTTVGSIRIRPPAPVAAALRELAAEAAARRHAVVGPALGDRGGNALAAVPLAGSGGGEVLVAVAGNRCRDGAQLADVLARLVPLAEAQGRSGEAVAPGADAVRPAASDRPEATPPAEAEQRVPLEQAAAIIELVAGMQSHATRAEAAEYAADRLVRFLECEGMAIGIVATGGGGIRLAASVAPRHDRDEARWSSAIESAMNEAVAWGEPRAWPACGPSGRHGALAHASCARRLGVESILTVPLYGPGGELQGALSLVGPCGAAEPRAAERLMRAAAEPLGTTLDLLGRAERGRWSRRIARVRAKLTGAALPAVLGALVAGAAVLAVPVPHRVAAPCQLEPVARRFVAAPIDGRLQEALVEPGEMVEAGQPLARLDGREIALELASVRADLSRAGKRRDAHLAVQDFGKATLERLEMRKLEARLRFLEQSREQLEIAAPIAGLIISGDLEGSVGAAIGKGDTLFEVAELDAAKVEIEIDQSDVAHVRAGQPVRVRFRSFAARRIDGTLERVGLRAEERNDRHVFIGEMPVDAAPGGLMPGMRGEARIDAGYKPLAWVLMHDMVERARMATGW